MFILAGTLSIKPESSLPSGKSDSGAETALNQLPSPHGDGPGTGGEPAPLLCGWPYG
jgi:hypothetical protein